MRIIYFFVNKKTGIDNYELCKIPSPNWKQECYSPFPQLLKVKSLHRLAEDISEKLDICKSYTVSREVYDEMFDNLIPF